MSTWPADGSSSAPAIVSSVLLPEPLGPMTATSVPGLDREVDVDEGIDPAGAVAVGLGHAAEVDGAHRRLPTCRRSRSGAVRTLAGGGAQRGGLALEAAVDAVEPADQRVEPEQLGVGDEQEAELVVAGVLLQPRVLLHQLEPGGGGGPAAARRRRPPGGGGRRAP